MTVVWDPQQYERFGAERARPFGDLVAAVDAPGAARVVDLGCGDGSLTATLRDRWPAAHVEGVDSSPAMIGRAAAHAVEGELDFTLGAIEDWQPGEPVDVIVSNAALQWVPGHLGVLGMLAGHLRPGGTLAFQVPGNFREPTHLAIAELCAEPRWRDALAGPDLARPASHEPAEYLAVLLDLGFVATVWETTYCQPLQGENAVLEWLKGTALRPLLGALGDADKDEFLGALGARLATHYPQGPHGTVLPFRRIFAVATAPGGGDDPPAVAGVDHVQVAIPPAGEDAARGFYAGLLGLAERPKPAPLAARGGCWFSGHATNLHVGIQQDFQPSVKAHVALSIVGLDALADRLAAAGRPVTWDTNLGDRRRFYTEDPFGNRLELLERLGA
jgi:trans-aconitate 2-methyltransferase